jgi:DNA polymerase-3 subunit alpha
MVGAIPRLLMEGQVDRAAEKASLYREIFGADGFFLELQDHGIPDQRRINTGLVEIAGRTGIPLVATNDVHYMEKTDARAQDILICIGTGKKITDGKRLKFEHPEFYFKTPEEMRHLFGEVPQALTNTLRVAEQCTLTIPEPGPQFPEYTVPAGHTKESYLESLAREGIGRRYNDPGPEVAERLRYELDVITRMGFTGYFLIVWDFVRFARERGIPVGCRGSGAGSLVAYALRITDVDPFRYGLLFERFLNPERVSMPDFDIDFCFERRGEVIEYVTRKYGTDRVAQIITFGTLGARAVIRDVARVLDIPYGEADQIAKLVPGPKVSLEDAFRAEPGFQEIRARGDRYGELLDVSRRLEGLNRHASTHAAGIVIAREPLTHYVPLYRDAKTGMISTQYSMEHLEKCGLVKMDFLGLKTLTLLQNTVNLIRRREPGFELESIALDDRETYRMLGEGRSTCVFQFESSGMQGVLRQAKPSRIEDLIALSALYRPGPMENIDQFVQGKHDPATIHYLLPELEPVLAETYGVIVYQEQVLQIARIVAGYSLGQADILRKAMGKKEPQIMAKEKEGFVSGARQKGYSRKTAEEIFEKLVPFAGYGFNKSHAAAYAILAYQTAYLKANYPAEFMAANLTNEMTSTDKLTAYIGEARGMGLEVLPPDANLSEAEFTVSEGRIVYGLLGIKNVGRGAVEQILKERASGGPYTSIVDFLDRVDLHAVNRKVVETLVLSGAMDSVYPNRATLHHNLERLLNRTAARRESRRSGQALLFDAMTTDFAPEVALDMVADWPREKKLGDEKQHLGFFVSGHPLDDHRKTIERHANLRVRDLPAARPGRLYTLVAAIRETREILTRTGQRMAFVTVEDYDGAVEVVIFPAVYEKCRDLVRPEGIVAVTAKVDATRGDPKLIAEELCTPEALLERRVRSVHARIEAGTLPEESLIQLRDYLIDRQGSCSFYIHLQARGKEVVIRASPQMRVLPDDEVLDGIRRCAPQVVEVWKQ